MKPFSSRRSALSLNTLSHSVKQDSRGYSRPADPRRSLARHGLGRRWFWPPLPHPWRRNVCIGGLPHRGLEIRLGLFERWRPAALFDLEEGRQGAPAPAQQSHHHDGHHQPARSHLSWRQCRIQRLHGVCIELFNSSSVSGPDNFLFPCSRSCTILLGLSYVYPVACSLAGGRRLVKDASWSLGRFGYLINIIARGCCLLLFFLHVAFADLCIFSSPSRQSSGSSSPSSSFASPRRRRSTRPG